MTHQLRFSEGRWTCQCGYVLGVHGHQALYAQCPLLPVRQGELTF
jgi:hypothetical protein